MSSERIRVALIGHGRWGRNVGRVLAALPECELVAVCDSDPARLAVLPSPHARALTAYGDVLRDESVQACVVCSPSWLHAEHAVGALQAGKHVFVEKPLATSVADAELVAKAALASGRRLMVGHIMLYHPGFGALTELVQSGALGRLRQAVTLRTAMVAPAAEDPWWGLAPHDVSLLLTLISAPLASIRVRRQPTAGGARIHAHLAFGDGVAAEISVGRGSERVRTVRLFGDHAAAQFRDDSAAPSIELFAPAALSRDADVSPASAPLRAIALPSTEPLALELSHFVRGLRSARPFRSDLRQGLAVTRILSAGEASLRSSVTVVLQDAHSAEQAWA